MLEKYFSRIPKKYEDEFLMNQTDFIKSRVKLLCGLVIGIYFSLTLISFLLLPKQFKLQEVYVWGSLVLGGLLILSLNKRARSIRDAKRNTYLFTALFLLILIRVNIINPGQIPVATLIYLLVLFLVSFTIPWRPLEAIPITLMHVAAYSYLYSYVQETMPKEISAGFSWSTYVTGLMFFLNAFVLVLIIRERESSRDIENFVLLKDVEAKNVQMEKELELANKVHQTLVPKSIETDLVDIAVMYLPMSYIGGDYARFHFIDNERLIFIICDVTGHGVSAALLVNRFHSEFEQLAEQGKEPGVLLKELNNFIVREFQGSNMYISAFCGLLDFKQKKFIYSNYAHPTQYFYKTTDSSMLYLGSQAALLGLSFGEDGAVYQNQADFERGNKLFMFTDGVIETRGLAGEEFGIERLEEFIKRNHGLKPEAFNRKLLDELSAFKTDNFKDDIFVLTLGIK
ncbi:MAG TPA: PP2C family protein-serine/threonine phosphatase [Candidatus Omnitrophota bacterium]|nr:PP2C family protein-serine/threonine phosphatase [Candidatus Omnitrophota bacterium]